MNSREKRLKRRYGITLSEWNKILQEQGGVCAGCLRPPSDFKHTFHVDHDHSTQIIRGLLCWNCNRMIPNRKNVLGIFRNLVTYLTDPPALAAFGIRMVNPVKRRKRK